MKVAKLASFLQRCGSRTIAGGVCLVLTASVPAFSDPPSDQGSDIAAMDQQSETDSHVELGAMLARSPGVGVYVTATRWRGPAERAGVRRGDYIMSLDGVAVSEPREVREAIREREIGSTVRVGIWRAGNEATVDVVLAAAVQPALPDQRPWLGVELEEQTTDLATVRSVYPGSPADIAGLKPGDRIIRIDKVAVESAEQFVTTISEMSPYTRVELTVGRGTDELLLSVELSSQVDAPWGWRHQVIRHFLQELPATPDELAGREEYERRLGDRMDDLQALFDRMRDDVRFLRKELGKLRGERFAREAENDNANSSPTESNR